MAVPNQYKITIKKPVKYTDAFYTGNCKNTNEAYQKLTSSGFGLYIWFLQNQSGYQFELYSVQVQKDLGISSRTYDRAISDLKANGYLIHRGNLNGNPLYDFYDSPQC
jgi:hypothetical protein